MKYIVPLKIDYDKKLCKEFINSSDLNFLELEKNQKWHNNVSITADLKKHFGEISNYLKDKILILTLFPDKQIKIHADGAGTTKDNTYNVSINFPVENCTKDTITHFWDFEDEREIRYIHHEKLGTREIIDKDLLMLKQNYVFRNKDSNLYTNRLYQVYRDGVAKLVLCRIHDIELFHSGEFRFLEKNLDLANKIANNNRYFSYG